MKKFLLLFLISITTLANHNSSTIKKYEEYQDKKLYLKLNEKEREYIELKKQREINDEILNMMYDDLRFRTLMEREELKNDLLRAQIYYYYHNGHKYYYFINNEYDIIMPRRRY